MTITVDATFENGQLKLKEPVARGRDVHALTITSVEAMRDPLDPMPPAGPKLTSNLGHPADGAYGGINRVSAWLGKHFESMPPDALLQATAAILGRREATEADVCEFWQGLGVETPDPADSESVLDFLLRFAISAKDSHERAIQQRRQEKADRRGCPFCVT
jgi:hypothetical protein